MLYLHFSITNVVSYVNRNVKISFSVTIRLQIVVKAQSVYIVQGYVTHCLTTWCWDKEHVILLYVLAHFSLIAKSTDKTFLPLYLSGCLTGLLLKKMMFLCCVCLRRKCFSVIGPSLSSQEVLPSMLCQ